MIAVSFCKVALKARLGQFAQNEGDTGAADCLFDRFYADILRLPEIGVERTYRTVTGLFQAFGHEVTIETLGLQWRAHSCFSTRWATPPMHS